MLVYLDENKWIGGESEGVQMSFVLGRLEKKISLVEGARSQLLITFPRLADQAANIIRYCPRNRILDPTGTVAPCALHASAVHAQVDHTETPHFPEYSWDLDPGFLPMVAVQ